MTRERQRTGMVLLYDVRYLEAGAPRRIRLEAQDAVSAVAAAAALTGAVEEALAPRFELLSVVPAAARIGERE